MHSMNEPGKSESGLSVVGQLKVLCSHTVMMRSKLGREGGGQVWGKTLALGKAWSESKSDLNLITASSS